MENLMQRILLISSLAVTIFYAGKLIAKHLMFKYKRKELMKRLNTRYAISIN